ncbi:MAG: SIS domain-containing protein, partial [Acetivibrio sp.]
MENKGIQAQNLWDEKKEYFNKLIENLNAVDMAPVDDIIAILMAAKKAKKRLYFIGNGGSAGIAVHYAADYMKTGEFSTQTFYDPALMTCMGNDY